MSGTEIDLARVIEATVTGGLTALVVASFSTAHGQTSDPSTKPQEAAVTIEENVHDLPQGVTLPFFHFDNRDLETRIRIGEGRVKYDLAEQISLDNLLSTDKTRLKQIETIASKITFRVGEEEAIHVSDAVTIAFVSKDELYDFADHQSIVSVFGPNAVKIGAFKVGNKDFKLAGCSLIPSAAGEYSIIWHEERDRGASRIGGSSYAVTAVREDREKGDNPGCITIEDRCAGHPYLRRCAFGACSGCHHDVADG